MSTAAAAAPPQLIDFAARQIPAQQIRAAGYSGVVNYVSVSRPGASFGAKPITRPYADSLKAAGLVIVSNYQYGKPGGSASSDFTRGYAGGISRRAHRLAAAHCRGRQPGCTDFLHHRRGHKSRHLESHRAAVVSRNQLGSWGSAHGGLRRRQGVPVGRGRWRYWASSTPGRRWVWQTRAWSGDQVHPAAVLYQRVVSTSSNPGPKVGGLEVDVNDVLASDCGQWNLHASHPGGDVR